MRRMHEELKHDAQRVKTKWTHNTREACGKAQALVLSGSTRVARGLTSEVLKTVRVVKNLR